MKNKFLSVFLSVSILITSFCIAGCEEHHTEENEDDLLEYLEDKYDIDATIVRYDDLNGKTEFDNAYWGTDYVVRADDREFNVRYEEKHGFSDNYLLPDIEDDFLDFITDEFDRSVVRGMNISVSMQMVDESVSSLRDLEDSDCSISIIIFSHGLNANDFSQLDIPSYSENTNVYVSDFSSSNLPEFRTVEIGSSNGRGVDSSPRYGDYSLYNFYAEYRNERWSINEYETIELDGILITYDKNSNVLVERITNTTDNDLPAFRISLSSPSDIEFIVDQELDIVGMSTFCVELDRSYTHNVGDYRIDITLNSSEDIIFTR